jgi:hypothetical protein
MRQWVMMVAAVLISTAAFASSFVTYANGRYGYSISYPADLLSAQPESDSGDGRVFRAKSGTAEFRVFASTTVEDVDDTPELIAGLAAENCPKHKASYRIVKLHLIATSCIIGTDIFYQKTLLQGEIATTMSVKYPKAESALWNPIISTMARSMTPGHFLNWKVQ